MNKVIELNSEELLILRQTLIRYLKLTEYKLDHNILDIILKKLGVTTHSTLIREAKERSEAK